MERPLFLLFESQFDFCSCLKKDMKKALMFHPSFEHQKNNIFTQRRPIPGPKNRVQTGLAQSKTMGKTCLYLMFCSQKAIGHSCVNAVIHRWPGRVLPVLSRFVTFVLNIHAYSKVSQTFLGRLSGVKIGHLQPLGQSFFLSPDENTKGVPYSRPSIYRQK